MKRTKNRNYDSLRPISFEVDYAKNADGSCLISIGSTKVLCTASIEERVPPFLKGAKKGWVTAEYSMLPRATNTRTARDNSRGTVNGRSQEIQRLIGRSLRAITNTELLGERQIIIDCDVIQADGGTRTAAIVGGFIALFRANQILVNTGRIKKIAIKSFIAAISCGIVNNTPMLDLEYEEDSRAEVDANFVMDDKGHLIEIQSTGELRAFTQEEFNQMQSLAQKGISEIILKMMQTIA